MPLYNVGLFFVNSLILIDTCQPLSTYADRIFLVEDSQTPPQKKCPFSEIVFLDVSDDFKQKKKILYKKFLDLEFFFCMMSGLEMNLTVLPNLTIVTLRGGTRFASR